jgi:ribosomal protein S18 acetylase RimI-like enzyme
MTKILKIRLAQPNEIKIGFQMLREAALWLKSKEIDYWQNWLDPPTHHKDWIISGFSKKEFRFIEQNNEIIGMIRLQDNDEIFWGNDDTPAIYIHSFTTKRSLAGYSIGSQILAQVELIARQNGKKFLRLDCGSQIEGLNNYYLKENFRFVRQKKLDGYIMNLYEREID